METPSALARMIAVPRRREKSHVDLAAPPAVVWRLVRHENLLRTRLLRWSFHSSSRWTRLAGSRSTARLCVDDLRSTPERPGLRVFSDSPPLQFCVGALARARRTGFSLVYARSIEEFSAFDAPGFVKLAWAAEVEPLGAARARLHVELRLGADDEAWRSVRWSFAGLKPLLHWAHRQLLGSFADELGWPGMVRAQPAAPGGFTLPDS